MKFVGIGVAIAICKYSKFDPVYSEFSSLRRVSSEVFFESLVQYNIIIDESLIICPK